MARAAHVGHAGAIDALCNAVLKAGGSPHAPDLHGWTPLHRAASAGHLPVVEALLRFRPASLAAVPAGAGCSPEATRFAESFHGAGGRFTDRSAGGRRATVTPLEVAKTPEIKRVLSEAVALGIL